MVVSPSRPVAVPVAVVEGGVYIEPFLNTELSGTVELPSTTDCA
jgi:hypothetical protein